VPISLHQAVENSGQNLAGNGSCHECLFPPFFANASLWFDQVKLKNRTADWIKGNGNDRPSKEQCRYLGKGRETSCIFC
jgi:hypothetical protein